MKASAAWNARIRGGKRRTIPERKLFGRYYWYRFRTCPNGYGQPGGWNVVVLQELLTGRLEGAHSSRIIVQWGCSECARPVVLYGYDRCDRCEKRAFART